MLLGIEPRSRFQVCLLQKVLLVTQTNTLIFSFKDGTEAVKRWADHSRAESWTPEMRDAARKKTLERGER